MCVPDNFFNVLFMVMYDFQNELIKKYSVMWDGVRFNIRGRCSRSQQLWGTYGDGC